MVNEWTGIGHIGKDPEVKTDRNGKSYATFSIALSKGKGDTKDTLWLNVTAFDKTADFIGSYLPGGSLVYIKGELAMDKYTDKEGVSRQVYKILANRVVSLRSKPKDGSADNPTNTATAQISADDIPF